MTSKRRLAQLTNPAPELEASLGPDMAPVGGGRPTPIDHWPPDPWESLLAPQRRPLDL
jgi:hypothetical protein